MILNQWTKLNDRSFQWFTKSPFELCFPVRQSVLNISQIAVAFHGFRPPLFIQTWLQQYSRCPLFHSVYCSLSNPICFWTVRGWCAMIPREIFTGFAKFQGIAPFSFLRSFCFAQIRLNPLSRQVLHHNCISVIVSRYSHPSLRTLCPAVIESPIFSARGKTPPIRLLHGALVMLVLWQISQFRSFGKCV